MDVACVRVVTFSEGWEKRSSALLFKSGFEGDAAFICCFLTCYADAHVLGLPRASSSFHLFWGFRGVFGGAFPYVARRGNTSMKLLSLHAVSSLKCLSSKSTMIQQRLGWRKVSLEQSSSLPLFSRLLAERSFPVSSSVHSP